MAHLLASIGTGQYRETLYRYGERKSRTRFAPVAIADLVVKGGGRASILVTDAAREKWFPSLADELSGLGFKAEAIDIPECRDGDQILQIFQMLSDHITEGEQVILDVTLAFRHLPFVYLAALAYLTGLKNVRVKGIYYGAHMMGDHAETPIIDITSLFGLIEWYRALSTANETGDFRPVGTLLRRDSALQFRQGRGIRAVSRAAEAAGRLAAALASGLPLEAGHSSHALCCALNALDTQSMPTMSSLFALEKLEQVVKPWAVAQQKQNLMLTKDELERQLLLAEWYLEQMNIHTALLMLREWLVNAVLLARGVTTDWLDYGKHRRPVESFLLALRERDKIALLGDTEREFVKLWGAVSDKRNEFAHTGMKPGKIPLEKGRVMPLLERCRTVFTKWVIPTEINGMGGRVLVSPLGLSPGSLFSALRLVAPDRALIITSWDGVGFIPEILENAGYSNLRKDVVILKDPHQGFYEAGRVLRQHKNLETDLVMASDVIVNITGGTTALQYAAESVGRRLGRYGTQVKRVALVDRRDILEQREDPYVVGELVELDDDE